ncbi:BsuBI/PstI family type II restriction endonuclease [Candidatus Chloroploca sp. Khr17]|uniref:BsuBI/PstI family type II restriction endonuclease n=1 Tax=Candidatus Chloroploca sp. Khr17 TaxID=2496869 RepID=UPI00101C45DE|nr:BsuBI/PstI family type II restriction endonuclease [Candidatus Chloroploca sp. Khr17]
MTMRSVGTLLEQVDLMRLQVMPAANARTTMGQVFTPVSLARLMAGLFEQPRTTVRMLDPGAGMGMLTAATVAALCQRPDPPHRISVTACELDAQLIPSLRMTMDLCERECEALGIHFEANIIKGDFLEFAANQLEPLFTATPMRYDLAILNPPYRKIQTVSRERRLLRRLGIEVSNLYAGFIALSLQLLQRGGELVAISPRSFCNGPYFRSFREMLLARSDLRGFYLFEDREEAFRDDAVLQETVITSLVAGCTQSPMVKMVNAHDPADEMPTIQAIPFDQVVYPHDPEHFFHLVAHQDGQSVASRLQSLPATLATLGLSVSTGRVVDFRATAHLRRDPGPDTAALLYPTHCERGHVVWPKIGKKPNALVINEATQDLLVPNEPYVLVKRFSSKEERRRVVATLFLPEAVPGSVVAFENHLNYIHNQRRGIDYHLARGLTAFLNSTFVDTFFRQFNGHTQVNATDLRTLRYPDRDQLIALGRAVSPDADQHTIDTAVAQEVFDMHEEGDPTLGQRRIQEALALLKLLGLPRAQQNERSALTLLALLNLKPDTSWAQAEAPLCGITPMMEFFQRYYGRTYAPNTRETVRRQTVHQFLEAGFITANPDQPDRPVNSPKAVYQIEATLLAVLQTYGTDQWEVQFTAYLDTIETLRERYARERSGRRLEVQLAEAQLLYLTPGGQNELVKQIVEVFRPQFAPESEVLYVGDAGQKFAFIKRDELEELNIVIDEHGKMPDVILFERKRRWLFLIEAVTSHGPIDGKRHDELRRIFVNATAGIIYITAFLDRKSLQKDLSHISWETEVWLAEAPSHLIHFDGERFLGPYDSGYETGSHP